jgi:hypothetical protein
MPRFDKWCPELEAALREPFDNKLISSKEAKNKKTGAVTHIPFVSWHHYVRRLNDLVGNGWSQGTPIVLEAGGRLVIGVPLTILGVTRINFGDEKESKDDFGTASTNAFAQGFKRTCAMFDIGLDMYDKEVRMHLLSGGNGGSSRQPRQRQQPAGTQRSAEYYATDEQKERIRELLDVRQVDSKNADRINTALRNGFSAEEADSTIAWLRKRPEKVM